MWRKLASFQRLEKPAWTHVALILSWIIVLSWGEWRVFSNSISACGWDSWEQWPTTAKPHHAIIITDPQLVDPHTYPGRPWPVSSLTIRHTDQYMRRAFTLLQSQLRPETLLFLGDLFDGGREWSTRSSKSPDTRWNRYNTKYWLKEYGRFGNIFFEPWVQRLRSEAPAVDPKIIGTLPGNHDLGFSNGIQIPVRDRFEMFFGHGNRVDIVGNHSFVSIDTVSLSAKANQVQGQENHHIWSPAENFLEKIKEKKAQTLERELRFRSRGLENSAMEHVVIDPSDRDVPKPDLRPIPKAVGEMPTVLLTHVPLYREQGTPCGPLRERWPPTDPKVEPDQTIKDDANAIRVASGYQYQNVLEPSISKELVEKIGGVEYVFSGDDHDYCDVIHRGFTSRGGGIREVTVKSISWAMGVRKPGFLMLSLWNPIDENGNSIPHSGSDSARPTLQTHLCLLPNQLTIFIRYLLLLVLTIVTLVIHAVFVDSLPDQKAEDQYMLLPLNQPPPVKRQVGRRDRADSSSYASSSRSEKSNSHLAARSTASRIRSVSPYAYGLPVASEPEAKAILASQKSFDLMGNGQPPTKSWSTPAGVQLAARNRLKLILFRFRRSMILVALVGLFWYALLASRV